MPGSPGEGYLADRGLDYPSVLCDPERRVHRIGYVADPMPGHEAYRGFLAIPYVKSSHLGERSVASIRFRCLEDHDHRAHGHGKYMTAAGDRPRLYNTDVLSLDSETVAITEGELDALTAEACGIPAVGVPGAQAWQPFYREIFLGYGEVLVLADGDDAGERFAKTVADALPNARIVLFPRGEDTNSFVLRHGRDALLERVK